MRLLIVSQYFWPESFIINDLAKVLVQQGHSVDVLTGKPNYPEGIIFKGYKYEGCESETFYEKINVFRVPLRPRKYGGAKNLFLNYLSFVFNGLRYFFKEVRGRNYDVLFVFAMSPITMAIPAIYLKRKMKLHLALWVQDLWPESLSATGYVRNKLALRITAWIVRWIYSCADTLLVQSRVVGCDAQNAL